MKKIQIKSVCGTSEKGQQNNSEKSGLSLWGAICEILNNSQAAAILRKKLATIFVSVKPVGYKSATESLYALTISDYSGGMDKQKMQKSMYSDPSYTPENNAAYGKLSENSVGLPYAFGTFTLGKDAATCEAMHLASRTNDDKSYIFMSNPLYKREMYEASIIDILGTAAANLGYVVDAHGKPNTVVTLIMTYEQCKLLLAGYKNDIPRTIYYKATKMADFITHALIELCGVQYQSYLDKGHQITGVLNDGSFIECRAVHIPWSQRPYETYLYVDSADTKTSCRVDIRAGYLDKENDASPYAYRCNQDTSGVNIRCGDQTIASAMPYKDALDKATHPSNNDVFAEIVMTPSKALSLKDFPVQINKQGVIQSSDWTKVFNALKEFMDVNHLLNHVTAQDAKIREYKKMLKKNGYKETTIVNYNLPEAFRDADGFCTKVFHKGGDYVAICSDAKEIFSEASTWVALGTLRKIKAHIAGLDYSNGDTPLNHIKVACFGKNVDIARSMVEVEYPEYAGCFVFNPEVKGE